MIVTGFDAYSPREIAERVQAVCLTKARTPLLSLVMLGILAGAFIALGSLFYVIVASDPGLGFAAQRVLGGLVFSLGLLLVVVAGAELFTGNNLLAMAWADGCVTTREVLGNWVVVCAANFVGALGMAVWMTLAGRSVTDKFIALLLPIAAFVAAGFEHSIANMYFLPLGYMLQAAAGHTPDLAGLARNLVPVIAGNLVGGSVLVALVYYVIYRRPAAGS
jgi:formate transporter